MSAELQRLQRAQTLAQHLVSCPGCGRPSAAHIDPTGDGVGRLVRLVCPNACDLPESAALAIVAALTQPAEQAAVALPA